jgi:hypothetical protein
MTYIKIYITTHFIKFNNILPKLFSNLSEIIFRNPPMSSSEHLLWPKNYAFLNYRIFRPIVHALYLYKKDLKS